MAIAYSYGLCVVQKSETLLPSQGKLINGKEAAVSSTK